jgi:hypothetical protein
MIDPYKFCRKIPAETDLQNRLQEPISCDLCFRVFASKNSFSSHMSRVHKSAMALQSMFESTAVPNPASPPLSDQGSILQNSVSAENFTS